MNEQNVLFPDEEIGGEDGMKLFVRTEIFQRLNVGFALDEGEILILLNLPYILNFYLSNWQQQIGKNAVKQKSIGNNVD